MMAITSCNTYSRGQLVIYSYRIVLHLCTVQVYAAYNLRRDLSEAAKPAAVDLDAASTLTRDDLQRQQYADPTAAAPHSTRSSQRSSSSSTHSSAQGQVPLEPPLMRQAIAWQLCHRQLMHERIRAAADLLKRELKADDVKDLQVSVSAARAFNGHPH